MGEADGRTYLLLRRARTAGDWRRADGDGEWRRSGRLGLTATWEAADGDGGRSATAWQRGPAGRRRGAWGGGSLCCWGREVEEGK
ncbi:unnamed protein product [Linum trigynum]|uniref:Uncharacterized protein n=1 Tax=Linum trigynum TaxID=586398 RepID=A0AAV2FY32_9ROSI